MRYALIDQSSGFVWWVGEASVPIAACQAADDEIGPRPDPVFYEEQPGPSFTNESGYHVYEVPAGFDVNDGQDQQQIDAVSKFPRAAYVRVSIAEMTE